MVACCCFHVFGIAAHCLPASSVENMCEVVLLGTTVAVVE